MACNECYDSSLEPCSQGVGCTDTFPLSCIYTEDDYCAGIVEGDTLDEMMTKLCTFISDTVPGTTDYAGFSYTNGTYTLMTGTTTANIFGGTGTSITTIDGFVEGVTDATLNLHGRVDTIETPVSGAPCALFTTWSSSTTIGTTIEDMAGKLCNLATFLNSGTSFASVNGSVTASPACFTTTNSATTLAGHINWLSTNICAINTLRVTDIAALDTRIQSLEDLTFGGTSNGLIDNSGYVACLGTGSGADSLKTTVVAVRDAFCTASTTLASVAAFGNTISLTYSACLTSPGGGTGAASATALAHLNNIIAKTKGYTFGAGFSTVVAGCGTTVTLDSTYIFSCSSLNACDLSSHNDVTTYVSATLNGYTDPVALIWASADAKKTSGSGAWRAKKLIFQSSDASATVTPTINTNDITVDIIVPTTSVQAIAYTYPANTVVSTMMPTASTTHYIKRVGDVVYMNIGVDITNGTWLTATYRTIATITTSAGRPTDDVYVPAMLFDNEGAIASYATIAKIEGGTGVISVYNPTTGSIAPVSPDIWSVVISGVSYLVL